MAALDYEVSTIKASDGTLVGVWDDVDEAVEWAEAHTDEVGDWVVITIEPVSG